MSQLATINLNQKTVLLRADLNVPIKNGEITNNARLDRIIPTLNCLAEAGAKIVILSHLGRPDGEKNLEFSLKPVAEKLAALWGNPIAFASDCIGETTQKAIKETPFGSAIVLENTRFYKEETKNDPAFAKELAALGDIFVSDAFSAAHRAHASTTGIANYLPAVPGLLMEEEINALTAVLQSPEHPVTAIIGGAKISTKLALIANLLDHMDHLIIGGAMANTLLFAQGKNIGDSLYEPESLGDAQNILTRAEKSLCKLHLPTDVVTAPSLNAPDQARTKTLDEIKEGDQILDIGETTVQMIEQIALQSKTIVWNGPLGVFETKPFDEGTTKIAKALAKQTAIGSLKSIAGGGDTLSAIEQAGESKNFTYLSTAGGAFLEWLEGKKLPGIEIFNTNR